MSGVSFSSCVAADMENAIGQAFGIFDFEANGPDPQEEALARRLQRKKKKKDVYKRQRIHLEVDFIATLGSKKYYIQSALSIPDREKEIQESRSLTNINDSFKQIIVVKDHIMPRRNEEGILTVGLFDFLLKEDSLDI